MKKFYCAVFSLLVSAMILFAEETTEKQSPGKRMNKKGKKEEKEEGKTRRKH